MQQEAPSKNLDKVLDLILYLSRQDEPQNIAQLARYLGVTRNTIYAMLASLSSRAFVEKTADGRYTIGYGLLGIVANYNHQYPFLYVAEKHMLELAAQLGTSVSILVYKSPLNCLRLYSTESAAAFTPGSLVHACTTAPGKLLLAAQPDEVIRADLAARPIEAYTARTITDPEAILAAVPDYRAAETAVEFGERFPESGTAAAAVRSRSGRAIAALSVFLPARMEDAALQSLCAQLRLTALRISEELGNASSVLI